ncbi:MAG: tetratricopeptide repeat protein [Alphaproteobacteria bacterium]|nr:tetratricopeptide repeat protein [Alphaproteobacteria bacterium]
MVTGAASATQRGALAAALEAWQRGDAARTRALLAPTLAEQPADKDAASLDALCRFRLGDRDGAIESLGKLAVAFPRDAAIAFNRAKMLRDVGRLEEAIDAYAAAAGLDPADPEILVNLANARLARGDAATALADLDRAARLPGPGAAVAYARGLALQALRRKEDAAESFRAALRSDPAHAQSRLALAKLLHNAGHFALAETELRAGLAELPPPAALLGDARRSGADKRAAAEMIYLLGWIAQRSGNAAAARQMHGTALALDPDDPARASGALLRANCDGEETRASLRARHEAWARRFAPAGPRQAMGSIPTGRPLRIGFLSPDLRTHSIVRFLEPLWSGIDRAQATVHAYSTTADSDDATARLRASASAWRDVGGFDDAGLAACVRADGIDVLVEISGHMTGHRLGALAHRAAPLQVTWLGYPNTTGSAAIDVRLADAITDPPGDSEDGATELIVRLPGPFLCFAADATAPAPAARPAGSPVAFGSFNDLAKISDSTVAMWSRALVALPGSTLLLKGFGSGDPSVQRAQRERFASQGVAPERIAFRSYEKASADHLALYGEIDVALDPWPYNGTTTSCEALWMGVPVVTRRGTTHASRVGASLLARLSLGDLVGDDAESFVRIAAALAADRGRLDRLRVDLRPTMARSSLCDARSFAQGFVESLRAAWPAVAARRAAA